MSQFAKYTTKKPREFTRLVGVSYGTFMVILKKLREELSRYLSEQPMRKRGRKCSLSLEDQLLLCLLYLRNYDTLLTLGLQFGISESYTQKRYNFIKMLLLRSLDLPDEDALKAAIGGDSVAIDVTEQSIERPFDDQESYYSGKKNSIR